MGANNKRIEFIDLAKGICILLIIVGHIGFMVDLPGVTAMRTPLYLALSGLFFKDYGGFGQLLVRKTNKIFIPFLFFYVTGYIIFYLCRALFPGLFLGDAKGILDVFTQNQYFNGPIWFLLVLFWCNLVFCVITLNVKKEIYRLLIVILLFFAGYAVEKASIFLPCMLDAAMIGMPFFYFGYLLKKSPLLYSETKTSYTLLLSALLFCVAYVTDKMFSPIIFFHDKIIEGNLLAMAVLACSSVVALLLLCKSVKRLPVVSYIGRYSIISLCLHHLFYRPLQLCVRAVPCLQEYEIYIVSLLTIALCMASIPVCIKYLPYVTAQRDLIATRDN